MAKSTANKGYCLYCGKEFSKSGIARHLATCADRQKALDAIHKGREDVWFTIVISGAQYPDYWIVVETSASTTLKTLDSFLRRIWLECCGHMSEFTIGGVRYMSDTSDFFGGMFSEPDERSMNVKLGRVLWPGAKFSYEYDFGSTTYLSLRVAGEREGKGEPGVTLLSRNHPYHHLCDACRKNEAEFVEPIGYSYSPIFLCASCLHVMSGGDEEGEAGAVQDNLTDEERTARDKRIEALRDEHPDVDEEIMLTVCNSPRMGECAYEDFSDGQLVPRKRPTTGPLARK